MKTISDYTIYCTEAQTKKALELGAPLEKMLVEEESYYQGYPYNREVEGYRKPTAEQLIGWLEEQGLTFLIGMDDDDKFFFNIYLSEGYIDVRGCDSRIESTLAAIDEALEYLIQNKKQL